MRFQLVISAIAILTVSGCATAPTVSDSFAALQQAMASCTDAHGYDPDKTDGLGDFELSAGERAWRACVYAAIEAHMIPHTTIPAAYRRLIAEDRAMTEKIDATAMTRAEREKRIDELTDAIKTQEEGVRARQEAKLREIRDLEQRRRRLDAINRLHRQINAARDAVRNQL